jgi:predicted Zn-dependent peptidase
MLKTYRLKNGMRVATYNMPTVKSLHLGMSVKGGSIVESEKNNGLAHYMEHMMCQGIPSFKSAELLSNYVESLAGRYNASTSSLVVHFNMTVPFSHLEDAIKIASEVFFHPTFPKEAMEKERIAVLNELKQHFDSRWYKFNKYFRESRYVETSTLQRETIGQEDIIKKLTREDLLEYWKTYFIPQNMYLFIGGNFSDNELEALLSTYMKKNSSTSKFPGFPEISRKDLKGRMVGLRHDPSLQVNYVTLSFPSIDLQSSTRLKIIESVALDILGRYRSSRLFRLLRYQRGLVYGVSASNTWYPGVGHAFIDSEVAQEQLDEVIVLITSTLQEYIEKGPTEAELSFAKHYLTNQWLMAFDSPGSIGDWVEGQLIWRETIQLPEEYIRMVEDISVKDITSLMQKEWDMKKLQLLIQGPIEDTAANKEKYTKLLSPLQ